MNRISKHWKIKTASMYFMLMVCLLSGCSRSVDPVASRIMQSIKKDGSTIRIAEATDFEWDQLYVFPPYSLLDDMEKTIGSALDRRDALLGISVDEGFCFFVFLKQGVVVRSFYAPRFPGDFSSVEAGPYSPQTARFEASLNGDWCIQGRWKVMKQVSPIL